MGFRLKKFGSWQLFFNWVGPVPGRFARGEVIDPPCPWRYFLAGLSLRKIGGKGLENVYPAEPDDPNSFSLNPNEYRKPGRGELEFLLAFQDRGR
jgi:hypothetical protein